MRRYVYIILWIGAMFILTSCSNKNIDRDIEVLYWKTIELEMIDVNINYHDRYGNTVGVVNVKSDEYGLNSSMVIREKFNSGRDIYYYERNFKNGNIRVYGELYSWVNNRTGEVNRRIINKIEEIIED